MVRIMGSSSERVRLSDLNDVIYYRQQKEYTDQEFEQSKDLKREIQKGRVLVLEQHQTIRSGVQVSTQDPVIIRQTSPGLSQDDIKRAVAEVLGSTQAPATVDAGDIKRIILEVMNDYKADGNVTSDDIRKIVSEVVSEKVPGNQSPAGNQDVKKMLTDILNEYKQLDAGVNLKLMMQSLMPMIAETVRNEVAKIPTVIQDKQKPNVLNDFIGPEYIPDISTEGMISNIKTEERVSSIGDVSNSLEALKQLRNSGKI